MAWEIKLSEVALKCLKKLDKPIQKQIIKYLKERVAKNANPKAFGKPLSHEHFGLWRYRVGDYRVICKIEEGEMIVLVVRIGHRKNIY